jgi:membrane protein required for beta-lactamase induction
MRLRILTMRLIQARLFNAFKTHLDISKCGLNCRQLWQNQFANRAPSIESVRKNSYQLFSLLVVPSMPVCWAIVRLAKDSIFVNVYPVFLDLFITWLSFWSARDYRSIVHAGNRGINHSSFGLLLSGHCISPVFMNRYYQKEVILI